MLLEPLQLSAEETVYKSGKGDSTSLNVEVLYRKHKRGFLTISVTVVESNGLLCDLSLNTIPLPFKKTCRKYSVVK